VNTSTVISSIILLILAGLLGTAIFGILWAAIAEVLSVVRGIFDRASPRTSLDSTATVVDVRRKAVNRRELRPKELPESSPEALWHRMQGTTEKPRWRNVRS
jgi:hypothetical protein